MNGVFSYSYGVIPFSSVTNVQFLIKSNVPDPKHPSKLIEITAVASSQDNVKADMTDVLGLQVWFGSNGMIYLTSEEWRRFLKEYDDWLALH
jgi:hypothetical protein